MKFGRLAHLLAVVLITVSMIAGNPVYAAANAQQEATAAAEPDLHFGLVPVGDHPQGYFSNVPINPGETITLEVDLVNFGDIGVELKVYNINANNGLGGGFSPGPEDEEPVGLNSWIDFPEFTKFMEPSTQERIAFTITAPADAAPGQYVSGLAVEMTEPLAVPGTDIVTQIQRYAISVGVVVPGELVYSYELGEPFLENQMLTIPVINTGNYLVRPTGEVRLTNAQGVDIVTSPVGMGSVYGGNEATIGVFLPPQTPFGDYTLNVSLTDPESGATAEIVDAAFNIPEPEDPLGLYLREHSIEPNAEDIVFANVSVTLENGGGPIPESNVTLGVSRDGELVEEFPLATNQTLTTGMNELSARYLPAEMWEPGTYTFHIRVAAVDPNTGEEIELLFEVLDAEIVVP